MILVTVGTEKFPFNRLMKWVDLLVQQDWLTEQVIVQYGSSTFIPKGVDAYQLLPASEFSKLAMSANLVIGHCGEGTLSLAEKIKAPYLLVPRKASCQEHVDNHQLELAHELANSGVPIAFSYEELFKFVQSPYRVHFSALSSLAIQEMCQSLESFSTQNTLTGLSANRAIKFRDLKTLMRLNPTFVFAQSTLQKLKAYQRSAG